MKKISLTFIGITYATLIYAQSVYMHEAQQDAEESGASGFSGIVTIIVFFGLVYITSALWGAKKKKKNEFHKMTDESASDLNWEEKEKAEEKAEIETLASLKEGEGVITNTVAMVDDNEDLPPMQIADMEQFRKREKEHEDFLNRIVKQQEDKYFPIGSIEERLKGISTDPVVDLGLTVKWSSMNIGAHKLYEMGYQFRWGTFDYIENFDRNKLAEYYAISFDKEIDEYKEDISGNENFDAALKFSEGTLRIPTKAECEELIEKCRWDYVEVDKYKGFIVTGPSGQSIYLPLSYSSFVNCYHTVMISVSEAYMTSTPKLETNYELDRTFEGGGSSYRLIITNNNHKTESFTKRIDYFSRKHRFSPIRGVCR